MRALFRATTSVTLAATVAVPLLDRRFHLPHVHGSSPSDYGTPLRVESVSSARSTASPMTEVRYALRLR